MNASELRGRDAADLQRDLQDLQKQLFELKFQWQAEENPNTNHRTNLRKDIARVKTVLREMEREAPSQ
jgi:large subunit ribosomal protein L29